MSKQYHELLDILQTVGKDPSRLIFEDELTGINNRRFLHSFFEHKVRWRSGEDYPLSLLMLDLDHFKQINDTHGHDAGDQALQWLSSMLREVGGESFHPVRYGGDEFMLLAPGADADEAGMLAQLLLRLAVTRPLRLAGAGEPLPISLSIGIACAPNDAKDAEGLIHQADTALYHSKHAGRGRATNVQDVDSANGSPKAVLRRLKSSGVVGRDDALAAVSDALETVARQQSGWILFEGGAGMGKSAMLGTVRKNLETDPSFQVVTAAGVQQEAYRPYYLLTSILATMLSAPEVDGNAVLANLTAVQTAHLGTLLPRVGEGATEVIDETDVKRREGIFSTAAHLITRLAGSRRLVLLIDDLELADESTLYVLRSLTKRPDLTVLVCGGVMDSGLAHDGGTPLEQFRAKYEPELDIQSVLLGPLDGEAVAQHLRLVFPGLGVTDTVVAQLVEATQGNPLFLMEVIRKLVLDQKVSPAGQEWTIKPLEDGYLPRSLEEIVAEKIGMLDDRSKDLLAQASTLGEDVPVSVLAGASNQSEQEVQEFLDRAEALGLVQQGFRLNDDNMRFLGKRILDICYGQINGDRRQELHERVGTYQESLNEGGVWPAASLLAYHFKRSANQTKARQYERMQVAYRETVFNPDEAARYVVDETEEPLEQRLTPESLPLIPGCLRALVSAVRAIQLYPAESQAATDTRHQALSAIDAVLAGNRCLHLTRVDQALLANGQRLDVTEYGNLAQAFVGALEHAELKGVSFEAGLTESELGAFVEAVSQVKPETVDHQYWKRFSEERRFEHLQLEQMRYASVRRRVTPAAGKTRGERREGGVQEVDLDQVPAVLRAFTGAAITVKLYPVGSSQVTESIGYLRDALGPLLRSGASFSLAVVNRTLLANGVRVPVEGNGGVAERFISLTEPVELRSITFTADVTTTDLEALVEGLREPPPEIDVKYWREFAQQQGFSGVALNEQQYQRGAVEAVETLVDAAGVGDDGEPESLEARLEALVDQPAEALRTALPQFGRELLARGEIPLFGKMLRTIYTDFDQLGPEARVETVRDCARMFDGLIFALRRRFLEATTDFLLRVLAEESDAQVLVDLTDLLRTMAATAVQFGDYDLAGRFYAALSDRRRALEVGTGDPTGVLARQMSRELDPVVAKVFVEDLVSGEAHRQEAAGLVLGSLGPPAIPLLVDIIKSERRFRTRQMAARVLADLGPRAASQLKRELLGEVSAEQRFRIVEVLDVVTRRVKTELTFCLGDSSAKIRNATYQLAERIGDPAFVDVVAPFARHQDPPVALGAIRCLSRLGTDAATSALVDALETAPDPDRAVACAQALGMIGSPIAIEALSGLLASKRGWLGRRRRDDHVRVAAAAALSQIQGGEAEQVLARLQDDPDPQVRQMAVVPETEDLPALADVGSASS